MRELKFQSMDHFPDPRPPVSVVIDRDNQLEIILERLPQKESLIAKKFIYSNWSKAKIARHLGISHGRVRQLLKRAVKHMDEICRSMPRIKGG